MNNRALELELRALASAIDWPATPEVAAGIGARLPERPGRARWRWSPAVLAHPLAASLLLAIVVLGVIAGSVSPVRAKIEHLLGIAGGERVVRTKHVRPAAGLALGRTVSLAEARRLANFTIVLPRSRPAPSAVRVGGDLGPKTVSLLYGTETVLTEFPDTSIYPGVKQVASGVPVRFFDINHSQGIWVAAGPRTLQLQGADGRVHTRAAALPGSGVLLWSRGSLALRLETRHGLSVALALARSAR